MKSPYQTPKRPNPGGFLPLMLVCLGLLPRASLRHDMRGELNVSHMVTAIIVVVLGIVIIFALLPVVSAFIGSANLTGTQAAVAGLVVTVLVIVAILLALKALDAF